MQPFHPLTLVCLALGTLAAGCTAKDSLLDSAGAGRAGASSAGGTTAQGGSGQATGGSTAEGGRPSAGGTSAAGSSGVGVASSGGSGNAGTSGDGSGGSDGGEAATSGSSSGGNAGASGSTGGTSAAGMGGEPGTCPPGQMWCPGCTVGSGLCAVGCPAAACSLCADVVTEEECEARTDCHSVFEDPGTCGCGSNGCCARFARCADGDQADCQGLSVMCDAMTPYCDSPAYVVSAAGWCYEGCVDPKDCAPTCTAPDDPSGCACYSDADCAAGSRCYSADCPSETLGTCRTPPTDSCFGDADCPTGQTCIGGRPAPCGTTIADGIGSCGVEACPEGDCSAVGPDCTCSDGSACVAATGPMGSGQCRADDGTCTACKCAAPDTPIATPSGERAIAELVPGDLVYSVDGAAIVSVPVLRVNRTPVHDHHVLHVTFDNGRSIEMTAGHPLADGRPLSTLQPGSELPGGTVVSVVSVPYAHTATYDILPDSPSGAYFASNVLVGSTLAREHLRQRAGCGDPIAR